MTKRLNWTVLNGPVVFPTFLNLSLNLAIRSSWSEPQWAPNLIFADCIELLHLWLERIESIWFWCWPSGAVHVLSLRLVVERGCLLWPMHSVGQSLLAFALLHSVLKAKFACFSRCFLTFNFCIPVPYNEKDIFLVVSSKKSCGSS